jgi:nicotinate dehydrogenase subunit A
MATYRLRVNGHEHVVRVAADTPLLYVLRNDLALNGPKFGCGLAQCGACAVLRDGREIRSCVTPVAQGWATTLRRARGLARRIDCIRCKRRSSEKQAAQCGYCTCGMLAAAVDLLRSNPKPTADEIKKHMDGHLCRCGSHLRILDAIGQVASAEVPI